MKNEKHLELEKQMEYPLKWFAAPFILSLHVMTGRIKVPSPSILKGFVENFSV